MGSKYDFKGKNIYLTGAATGIGRCIALELAKNKAGGVALISRNEDLLMEVAKKIESLGTKAVVCPVDITSKEQMEWSIRECLNKLGQIDMIINNAGILLPKNFEHHTMEDFRNTFEVNFFAPVAIIMAFLPHFKKNRSGFVVNVASVAGKKGFGDMSSYSASKFALSGLTESLRLDLKKYNIRTAVIYPNMTDTRMIEDLPKSNALEIFDFFKWHPPELVAKKLINGIKKGKYEIYTETEGYLFAIVSALNPKLADFLMQMKLRLFKIFKKSRRERTSGSSQ